MRGLLHGAALWAALACAPAAAEPVTVDTLLALEDFGRIETDPADRWVVVERVRAQSAWPRYDLGWLGGRLYGSLYAAPADGSTDLRPLFPDEASVGYSLAALSPDGSKAAVYRLEGDNLRLGIVTLANRSTIWSAVAPALPLFGRAIEWADSDHLIVLGPSDGALPYGLSDSVAARRRLPVLWAAAARGEAAFSVEDAGPTRATPPRYGEVALWRVDAQTGEASILARGPFTDFELSWDGRTAAVLAESPGRLELDANQVTEIRRQRSLRLVDTWTGSALEPSEAQDVSGALLAWSPSGDGLLVYDRRRSRYLVVRRSGRIWPLDPSLAPVRFSDGEVPGGGWIGQDPVVRARSTDEETPSWRKIGLEGKALKFEGLGETGAALAQLPGGLLVSKGERLVKLEADLSVRDLGRLASMVRATAFGQRGMTDPMKRTAAAILEGGRVCRVSGDIQMDCRAIEAPGQVAAVVGGAAYWLARNDNGVTILRRSDEAGAVPLMTLNERTSSTSWARPVRVEAEGAAGWLYLPKAEHPVPLVVIPYPGAASPIPPWGMSARAGTSTHSGQPLVSAGYAVLYPDLAVTEDPAADLAQRILAVVDAAASAHPLIDPRRVGLWGHSFGAWAVGVASTQSDRFGAVVALNGPYDPFSVLGTSSLNARVAGGLLDFMIDNSRWLETGQAALERPYWEVPGRYHRSSAVVHADRLTAPVLLLQGDQDFNVDQADLLYGALVRLGREPTLITFFGEDHSLMGPGNLRQMYAQTIGWFDRHLKGRAETTPGVIASSAAKSLSTSN